MGSVPGRNKRLESAISVLLLTLLLLIGIGVFIRQFNVDMVRFGIDTTTAGLLSEQIEPNTQEPALDALMPDGFKEFSEIETYDAGNLYEKINGKAPLYTESGFVKLFTRRLISKDDEKLWMELFVFDMTAVRNAFSLYSVQRRADADILSLFHTSFGYRTDNALYFVHGKYYIELVGSSESAQLSKAMIEIAQNTIVKLALDKVVKVAEIVELSLFPLEKLIPGSFKLYMANAFGFDGFTDIFTCRYKFGDETITTFLSKRPDQKD
ncbi:MAG: hypothetical protein IIC00_14780, partial [Planctomycetes bacterium]|nr:hypothetical protein [Planctomycetota bacterium]